MYNFAMADMSMQDVKKQVPPYMEMPSKKPTPDYPRVNIPLDALPTEASDWPMNGKYKLAFEVELVGRDQYEMEGSDRKRGSITFEIRRAGGTAIKSGNDAERVSRKGARAGTSA